MSNPVSLHATSFKRNTVTEEPIFQPKQREIPAIIGCTALNVLGWFPGVSIVSGAVRLVKTFRIIPSIFDSPSITKIALLFASTLRSCAEMLCGGIIFSPFDILHQCTKPREIPCEISFNEQS